VKVAIKFLVPVLHRYFHQVIYDQLMLGIIFCNRSDVEQEWTILNPQTEVPGIDPLHIMLMLFHFPLHHRPTSLPSSYSSSFGSLHEYW
jgi:hypothetical protein